MLFGCALMVPPRAGYTLPVFACAGAIAALHQLRQTTVGPTVPVQLLEPAITAEIPIEQVARLSDRAALAITRSDPGDNLDLTRDTPIWAIVEWAPATQTTPLAILGGEGIGKLTTGAPAIYAYAQRLFHANLEPWLTPSDRIQVTIVLPEGRSLAQRTSNAAFGVVEGLSLLGTTGIAQPLSAPSQLEIYRAMLREQAAQASCLVFCVGENGLDLGQQLGIPRDRQIKTANWLGPMLVEAGTLGVTSLLLFGYHGKLLKLAGGIFHTHHHVADGRLEILTAQCVKAGLPLAELQTILACATAEEGLRYLRQLDQAGTQWTQQVYSAIAATIDRRTQTYIHTHSQATVIVGTVLFDRDRRIIICSETGKNLLQRDLSVELK